MAFSANTMLEDLLSVPGNFELALDMEEHDLNNLEINCEMYSRQLIGQEDQIDHEQLFDEEIDVPCIAHGDELDAMPLFIPNDLLTGPSLPQLMIAMATGQIDNDDTEDEEEMQEGGSSSDTDLADNDDTEYEEETEEGSSTDFDSVSEGNSLSGNSTDTDDLVERVRRQHY